MTSKVRPGGTLAYFVRLRRSRYFLHGLLIGVVVAGLVVWPVTLFATRGPQWRAGGSVMAPTAVQAAKFTGVVRLPERALIVCEGDSLTYGFVRAWEAAQPAINGSDAPRSPTPYPETLGRSLGGDVTVVNRGYPGDGVMDGITRWADAPSGDLAIIMYGTNDAPIRNRGGHISVETYSVLLEAAVRRRLYGGAQVILLVPPSPSARSKQAAIDPYRAAVIQVGRRTNVLVVDVYEILQKSRAPLQADGLHMTGESNVALADALHDILAPNRSEASGDVQ